MYNYSQLYIRIPIGNAIAIHIIIRSVKNIAKSCKVSYLINVLSNGANDFLLF